MTTRTCTRALATAAVLAVAAVSTTATAQADTPPAGAGTTSHGYVTEHGVATTIDHPDAATVPSTPDGQTGTGTLGINDRGQVVGVYESPDRVVHHFVRDRKGRFTTIADPPGVKTDRLSYETTDINNRGQIVGFYNDDQGSTTSGFLREENGRFRPIAVPGAQVTGPFRINDRGQIVGLVADARGVHGFLWQHGKATTVDVPGATATLLFGINNRGQMVGVYVDGDGNYRGFLRDRNGHVTTIDAPGAAQQAGGTQLSSVNEHGQIVGAVFDAQGSSRGFRYERGHFTWIDQPGATYTRALDIDNHGHVVGDYGTKPRP